MSFLSRLQANYLGEALLKLTVPHPKNEHRPFLIRDKGLFVFLIMLLLVQISSNIANHSSQVLGFATNISVSEVINLTNVERANAGLTTLKENSSLNQAAGLKANDMFAKDYWAHFAPDGTSPWYFFNLVGYKYSWAGENLARDFATSGGVVSAWMASPGHRSNILNANFTETGVAVVNGNLAGEETTLVVQLFGKPVLAASSAPTKTKPVGSVSSQSQPTKLESQMEVPSSSSETSQQSNQGNQEEKQVNSLPSQTSIETGMNIPVLIKNSTASQKTTFILLILVASLFITDSLIMFKKRHIRINSHSFPHAAVLLCLIGLMLLYGNGTIL